MSETKNLIAVFLKHLEHTDMGEPPCTPGRECQAKLWLLSGGLERTLFPIRARIAFQGSKKFSEHGFIIQEPRNRIPQFLLTLPGIRFMANHSRLLVL